MRLTEDKTFVKYSPGSMSRGSCDSWIYLRLLSTTCGDLCYPRFDDRATLNHVKVRKGRLEKLLVYGMYLFVRWIAYGE
jgi:hypothetical protein